MKTLTIYALVLGVSVTALLRSSEESRPSYYAPLESVELETPPELLESISLSEISMAPTLSGKKQKSYHIYFENKFKLSIDVAIRYQDELGEWKTDGLTKLMPGEKRKMGKTPIKEYYYYASTIQLSASESFKFPVNNKSREKLRFLKEEIWECYNSEMCNAFAVFR